VWRAFLRIRSTRINGMGLGSIPWYETVRWAEREGLDDDETESLIDLVERLDGEEHRIEAAKNKGPKNGSDGTPSS